MRLILPITQLKLSTLSIFLSFILAISVGPAQAAGVLDRILERGKIVVATNEDYKPQSFQHSDGRWDGFDVEIAREIATRLGVSIEFFAPPWELVISGRWRGRWDIAVNSMAATKERAERLDFAAAYYFTPVRIAVFESDQRFEQLGDLKSAVIGVCSGCSYEAFVRGRLNLLDRFATNATFPLSDIQSKSYPDEWAAADALGPQDGSEIDALMASEPTLLAMMEEGYELRLIEGHVFSEPLAVATEKGEIALTSRVAEIIEEMQADGSLKKLSQKWFGTDYSRLVPPQ